MDACIKDVATIVGEAIEIASASDRQLYLEQVCAGDLHLRQRIEQLLDDHAQAANFLDQPLIVETLNVTPILEPLGTTIGRYKLREVLGEGGMGIVYVAEQEKPIRRKVALKVIKPGMDTREIIARFEAERQALALMDHPNIAKVLDAGTTGDEKDSGFRIRDSGDSKTPPLSKGGPGGGAGQEAGDRSQAASDSLTPDPCRLTPASGRPYFVMELIRGLSITDYCDQRTLPPRDRLKLFITVCQAIQHAHQKGIIHRDLKPSNVMITLHDGVPVPKVIDFGIAKALHQRLTEHTLYTRNSQMIGTPLYMSPEQAELSGLDVDTRSDVYSLGVLLYELLTGHTPVDKETFAKIGYDEIRRKIREDEPARPSLRVSTLAAESRSTVSGRRGLDERQLVRALHGELDWIVMKALEKDRNRRYESASELSQDLERHLDGEAVRACPPSASYQLRKYVRRNRIAMITGGLVAAALVLGTVVSTLQAFRATRAEEVSERRLEAEKTAHAAEQVAREAAEEAKVVAVNHAAAAYRQQYKAEMHGGLADWQAVNISRLYRMLDGHLPDPNREDLRAWEWYYLFSLTQQGRVLGEHRNVASSIAWSPNGLYLATTSYDGDAIVWDARSGALIRRFSLSNVFKRGVAWSPDSRRLAWGSVGDENAVRVWDRVTDEVRRLNGHKHSIISIRWSPDGRRLASTAMDNTARIWDTETWRMIHVLDGHNGHVDDTCWTRDGKRLFTAGGHREQLVRIWDSESGKLLQERKTTFTSTCVSFSPNGPDQLVIGDDAGNCELINTETWETRSRIHAHAWRVNSIQYNPNGLTFASAGDDGRIGIWDAATGTERSALIGHIGSVLSLAWDPDGNQLASTGADRSVRIWQVPPVPMPAVLQGAAKAICSLSWSPDDLLLTATKTKDGGTTTWNRSTNSQASSETPADIHWRASSPDGRFVATAFLKDAQVMLGINDLVQAKEAVELKANLSQVKRLVWSPDSQRLAAFGDRLEVWDVRDMRSLFRWQGVGINSIAWAADSLQLAAAGTGDLADNGSLAYFGHVHIFDVERQTRLEKLTVGSQRTPAESVAWNARGDLIAAGNRDGLVMVWEAPTGRPVVNASMHNTKVRSLDWSPDGRRIASAGDDGILKVWDSATGDELLTLTEGGEGVTSVSWSNDGQKLAAGNAAGQVRVWDASSGYNVFTGPDHGRARARMYGERARRLMETDRLADAIRDYSTAIELAPGQTAYRSARAVLYFQLGRFDDALADLNAAADLDPSSFVLESRIAVRAVREEWKEALPDATRDVELKQSGFARHCLALIYLLLERQDEYRGVCRQIFERNADHLIASDATMGAWACAIVPHSVPNLGEIVARVRNAIPDVNGAYNSQMSLGALLFRTGATEEAIEVLTTAVRTWEHDVPVVSRTDLLPAYGWFFLAMAHHKLGHFQEARGWFDKAETYTLSRLERPAIVAAAGGIYWNQRVVLQYLQREARSTLNLPESKSKTNRK